MKRCTMCQEVKPIWEFSVREDGRVRVQCRTCHSANHKAQPPKSDKARIAERIIRDRLGDMPNGCITAPSSVGQPPIVCPWYGHCRKLTSEEELVCEVSDKELDIPAFREGPQKPEPEYPWYIQP